MLYDIRLKITYAYGGRAGGGRHHLRLLPAALPGLQKLSQANVTIVPAPAERRSYTDFFGNAVVDVALPPGHDRVTFTATARVDRQAPARGLDLSAPLAGLEADIAAVHDLGPAAPHHFLGESPRIAPFAAVTAYARGHAGGTALDTVTALGLALHADMAFDPDSTTVDTPPMEAFARRTGVCQDFAQVMIAGLRGLGIPAGYVSGFLRTVPPPGQPRLEGADAMHAWVRAWCGREAGWVEFDPTNACLAGADHIVVGHGRDYGDVAPVAGVLRMSGGQKSRQAVDVIALD